MNPNKSKSNPVDMKNKTATKFRISSISFGSPISFELNGDHVIGRLLGLIPICKIHLKAVLYLRLASRHEVSPLFFMLNWPQMLLASHRAICPVYVLQTRKGQKIFIKMKGGGHFRLREAIARHSNRKSHKLVA